MVEERNFVVKSPQDTTSVIRRALNSLTGNNSVIITLEKDDRIEFSASFPAYAMLKIKILSPTSVIREKKNGMEQEVSDDLPDWVEGILSCPNKNCITSQPKEPTKPKFKIASINPAKLQCYYCGRYVDPTVLVAQLA